MSNAKEQKKLMTFTFRLAGDLLATIALPVSFLAWLGKHLDMILETRPKLLAAGILVSFLISTVSICQKALKYGEEYERLTEIPDTGPPEGKGPARGHPPPPRSFES
jgi:F0F1-type ATP synthase assembly protein I